MEHILGVATESSFDRRRFLQVAALLAVGVTLGSHLGRASSAPYKRKNIDSLTPTELADYKHAMQIVQNRSVANAGDRSGYVWQAGLHNDADRIREDGSIGRCEHNSEQFLPWHRAHLVGFERLLRAADLPRTASVAIPYWDWTRPASDPAGRFPAAFEEAGSPLFHQFRKRMGTLPIWDATDIRTIIQEPVWSLFAGQPKSAPSTSPLEDGPHNKLHTRIGTTMGRPETASNDPIFWSFHAFIDLIWARWQRVHTNTTSPQTFVDGNPILWLEPFKPQIRDTATTAGLGYEYDYDFEPDGPPILVSSPVASGRSVGFSVSATRDLFQTGTAAKSVSDQLRSFVRIKGIKQRHDTSYDLLVYIHPTGVDVTALSEAERGRYLVRSVTVWKGHHQSVPYDAFVDITAAVKAAGQTPWAVTIQGNALPDAETDDEIRRKAAQLNAAINSPQALFASIDIEER